MFSETFSSFLNLVRWSAAFLVLIGHARHLIFVEYNYVEAPNLIWRAIYFMTSLGHQAVMVFFVVSGLLVGGLTMRRWKFAGSPNLLQYGIARFSRIYTVLIPALLLGFLMDSVGLWYLDGSGLYTNSASYQSSMNYVVADALNTSTFIGNIFMLQGILVDRLGSNTPLWSLANEWWYYVIFALLSAAFYCKNKFRWIFFFVAVVIVAALPMKIVIWMIVWLLGVCALAWIDWAKMIPNPILGSVVFLTSLVFVKVSYKFPGAGPGEPLLLEFGRDFLFSVAFAFLLVSMSRVKRVFLHAGLHRFLAEFSYTTYLFHFPILVLLSSFAADRFGFRLHVQPELWNLAICAIIITIVWLSCFLLSIPFERKTNKIRKKLEFIFKS
jgi:peptidoglycan/LPS O-acetylase OafA/YrhL